MNIAGNIFFIGCPFSQYWETPISPTTTSTGVIAILGDSITLIDSGVRSSPIDTIFPFIKEKGLDLNKIEKVVLTHGHFDHCGGVQTIRKSVNAEVIVHEADRRLIEEPSLMEVQLHSRFPDLFPAKPTDFSSFEPIYDCKTVRNNEKLELSGHDFEVLHLPGHSAGSICIVERNLGLYIAGDSVQGKGDRRPLIFHSSEDYLESMRTLKLERPNLLVNAHSFPPYNMPILERERAQVHIEDSLKAIEELNSNVLEVMVKAGHPVSIKEIQGKIQWARDISIGCVLEEFSRKGKAEKLMEKDRILWSLKT